MAVKDNMVKSPPKGNVRFSISLSPEQKKAKTQILKHPYNFIVGKAGSGKTLLAVQVALDQFFKKQYNKIIITRPTISTEDNGFLPGSEREKMEPWLVPIRSNMRKVYNKPDILEKMEKDERIELVSLAHFRGRTFDNAVVIVDEYQNLTKSPWNACSYENINLDKTIKNSLATTSTANQIKPTDFVKYPITKEINIIGK